MNRWQWLIADGESSVTLLSEFRAPEQEVMWWKRFVAEKNCTHFQQGQADSVLRVLRRKYEVETKRSMTHTWVPKEMS